MYGFLLSVKIWVKKDPISVERGLKIPTNDVENNIIFYFNLIISLLLVLTISAHLHDVIIYLFIYHYTLLLVLK